METPFFSVIMPVYNSQKYLRRAIDSVLGQSFMELELILVDDCSIDDSLNILREYQKKDSRVIITRTKVNKGVANARNEGIKFVRGRYLTFVDSDDYIEKDLFYKVKEKIDYTGAQLIKYSIIEQYYDKKQKLIGKKEVCLNEEVFKTSKDVKNAIIPMEKLPLFGYLCNSFYDLETIPIDSWNFDEHMYVNEDFMMNIKLIDKIEIMACMSFVGYHYEKRVNNSLSTSQNDLYYECSKEKINILLDKYACWNLLTPKNKADIYWLYIRIIYSTICRWLERYQRKNIKEKIIRIYDDPLFKMLCQASDIVPFYKLKERALYFLLIKRNVTCVIFVCKSILFIKERFKLFFVKIKE